MATPIRRGNLEPVSEQLAIDEIVLRVPASPAYGRIVRMGAAALALRKGLSFAEIDEFSAAIDDAVALLLEPPAEDGAAIACRFLSSPDGLDLEAGRTDGTAVPASAAARFRESLSTSALTAVVEPQQGRLLLSLRKRSSDRPTAT